MNSEATAALEEFRQHLRRGASRALEALPAAIREDSYAISFLMREDTVSEEEPWVPTLTVTVNTEEQVRFATTPSTKTIFDEDFLPTTEDAGEARWNYAFWRQDPTLAIADSYDDRAGARLRERSFAAWRDEYKNIVQDNEIALNICADVGRRLHSDGTIETLFGRSIPIIIHDLEYYPDTLRATEAANPPGIVDDFFAWADECVMQGRRWRSPTT